MNAEEKKTLYKFFLTASAYFSGFKQEEAELDFSDDCPLEQVIPQEVQTDMQRQPEQGCLTAQLQKAETLSVQNRIQKLQEVYAQISVCNACRLCECRKNVVPGEGPAEFSKAALQSAEYVKAFCGIDVMVIGEGPGADEDMQGRPFVGRAGQLLDKMLAAIQLFRTKNCYIANVVKCRPPNNRDPQPDETAACRNFIDTQIAAIKPKAILIVGRVALQNLLQTSEGIGKMHGKFLEYAGIPLMATYHPSALLRDINLKRPAWEDLKLFRAKLDELKELKAGFNGSMA